MLADLFSVSILINIAALLYFIGFMVRDELLLRLLVLAGTCLYLTYYFLFPTGPLWNAIISSTILGLANIWVLGKIVFERTTLAMTEDEKSLYECLEKLTPGQFRKVMKHAKWVHAEKPVTLCQQEQKAENLFYLLRGEAELEKSGNHFKVQEKNYIGELAFILNKHYSATAKVGIGSCYVQWDNQELKALMAKDNDLANAINAMFNEDIALKLSASYQ